MTKQEAAAWIRKTYPIFRAHPDQWIRGEFLRVQDRKACFCVMGGAIALYMDSQGKRFNSAGIGWCMPDVGDFTADLINSKLYGDLVAANNGAVSVEDMIQRVEAVLVEAGL